MKDSTNIFGLAWFSLKFSFQAAPLLMILRLTLNVFSSLVPIVSSFVTSQIVNIISDSSHFTVSVLYLFVFYMVVLTFLTTLIEKVGEYVIAVHNELLQHKVDTLFSKKAISLDIVFFDSPEFYNILANAQRDSNIIPVFVFNAMQCMSSFITLLTSLFLLIKVNWVLSLITLVSVIPNIAVNKKYTNLYFNWQNQNIDRKRKSAYYYQLMTSRKYAQDLRFLGLGKYFNSKFHETWNGWYEEEKKLLKKRAFSSTAAALLPVITISSFLLYLAVDIFLGNRLPGDFVFYSSQLRSLQTALLLVISCAISMYDNKLKMGNIQKYFNLKAKVANTGQLSVSKFESLEFKNVTFSYPNTAKPALENISFSLNKNEKVAIVGLNGSGKTTLIKLILRFYDPSEGVILLNGQDIRLYKIQSLRKMFATMFQEYNLYAFTIKENISISKLCDKEQTTQINAALNKSGARDLIKSLPKGIDTYISREFSPDGIVPSTGCKQKIALACMFYRDSPVLLLDEPSASLDPEAEYQIFETINHLCDSKTVLFISHRLSNISMADRIVVLENGKIVEYGTHQELLSLKKRYYQLYHYQADKFQA